MCHKCKQGILLSTFCHCSRVVFIKEVTATNAVDFSQIDTTVFITFQLSYEKNKTTLALKVMLLLAIVMLIPKNKNCSMLDFHFQKLILVFKN